MEKRLMTDAELEQILKHELGRYDALSQIAPPNWFKQSKTTVTQLLHFSRSREDHFKLNLPMTLWCSQRGNPDPAASAFCTGLLKKYDRFLERHSTLPNAKSKVLEVFNPDWDLNDSRFMSILSELCFIELMDLKEDMTILGFDVPLLSDRSDGPNADLQLEWNGRKVFADVKSPTLTDEEMDPIVFRRNFEKFSEKDFRKKFGEHSATGVHRTLAYIYKFTDTLNQLFSHQADHLGPHLIQHQGGDHGNAQIYWLKPVTFTDGSRNLFLLDKDCSETSLMNDLNATAK